MRSRNSAFSVLVFFVITVFGGMFLSGTSWAQCRLHSQGLRFRNHPNLANFVKNRTAAIQLGKALFWDMQVGSDGIQSCASCHFHAGADNRAKNQLGPGVNAHDTIFNFGGANFTLAPGHFPITTNEVVSSQGVFNRSFSSVIAGNDVDVCGSTPDTDGFRVGGINVRRVEPRNTPTTINAAFNFHNFWDGRADNTFNGATPRGAGAADTPIFQTVGGVPTEVHRLQ